MSKRDLYRQCNEDVSSLQRELSISVKELLLIFLLVLLFGIMIFYMVPSVTLI